MRYTHLGRSGLTVSRLCLGTMNFGPQTGQAEAFEILDTAQAAGINFVDTANVTAVRATAAGPRKYSATGSPREASVGSARCSPPSCSAP